MNIELYLSNSRDAFGFDHDTPDDVSVFRPDIIVNKSFGAPESITIIISFAVGVSASVLGNWIYDKLVNHQSNEISINRKEIILEKGEITRFIQEQIDINSKQ
jgi:hypothetical protein